MSFPALTHVAITVTDLEASTRWYTQLFGADPVLDEDEESGAFHHAVFALGGGTLFGVHTHTGSSATGTFDEKQTGAVVGSPLSHTLSKTPIIHIMSL